MPYVGRDAASFTTVVDVTVSDDLTVTDDATIGGALSAKGGAVFNEDSADVDFRVESNGNANMLFVDGGNDKVGVGTNSPSGIFDVTSSANVEPTANITGDGTGYTHGAIALKSSTGNDSRVRGQGVYLFNEENDTTWYVGTSYQNVSAGSRPFDFNFKSSTTSLSAVTAHTDNTKLRIQADGTISAPSGIELGSGLDNTDANTLDDYEEGSWTPSLGGNTSYNSQVGRYVKVGNKVTVWANIYVNSIGTGSARDLSGLPFAPSNISEMNVNGNAVSYYVTLATSVSGLFAIPTKNATTIKFTRIAAGGTASMTHNDFDVYQNSTDSYFNITYQTG